MKLAISVIIPTKNEEFALPACLDSVLPWFDEIIVVDSMSTDGTQAVAESRHVSFVQFAWNGRYPKKKQWCLDNIPLKHEWVLFLDADERVPAALAEELQGLAANRFAAHSAYDISLAYHWLGKRLHHGQVVRKRVLLKHSEVAFPVLDDLGAPGMGEQEGHYQPLARGSVGRLATPLEHDDPDPFSTWIARHNRYSDWEAYLRVNPTLRAAARSARSRQGRILEAIPGKPLASFVYNYFVKLGFLDGRAGFEYAASLAMYQWQIGVKVRELQSRQR